MPRTSVTARATPPKFYVKTTNDLSQSNCKLANDNMTIEATTIINIGEEIQLYLGRPNIDDKLSDNNDSSNDDDDPSDDCDDKLSDNNDSSNDDDDSSDNNDDNSSDNNDPSDLGKKSTGDKSDGYNYDDNSRDDNDRSDLEKMSTGDKHKQREELSEDDVKEIRSLNYAKRELGGKIAMAKKNFEFYEKQVKEMNAKENDILGKGDKFSHDEWLHLQILADEIPQYEVNKAMAKREIDFWEEQIQEVVDKKKFILGGVVDSEEYEYAERRVMSSTYWMEKAGHSGNDRDEGEGSAATKASDYTKTANELEAKDGTPIINASNQEDNEDDGPDLRGGGERGEEETHEVNDSAEPAVQLIGGEEDVEEKSGKGGKSKRPASDEDTYAAHHGDGTLGEECNDMEESHYLRALKKYRLTKEEEEKLAQSKEERRAVGLPTMDYCDRLAMRKLNYEMCLGLHKKTGWARVSMCMRPGDPRWNALLERVKKEEESEEERERQEEERIYHEDMEESDGTGMGGYCKYERDRMDKAFAEQKAKNEAKQKKSGTTLLNAVDKDRIEYERAGEGMKNDSLSGATTEITQQKYLDPSLQHDEPQSIRGGGEKQIIGAPGNNAIKS